MTRDFNAEIKQAEMEAEAQRPKMAAALESWLAATPISRRSGGTMPATSRRCARSSSGATGSTRSPMTHGMSWRSRRSSPTTAARYGRKAAASRAPGCPGRRPARGLPDGL